MLQWQSQRMLLECLGEKADELNEDGSWPAAPGDVRGVYTADIHT